MIHRADVEWVPQKILKTADDEWQYQVWMPSWLAEWGVFDHWERLRFESMRTNLRRGEVLFDIGTEFGWNACIYSSFVGPENMCLFEPGPQFWPNIEATWKANCLADPKATWIGLVGADTTDPRFPDHDTSYRGVWPERAFDDVLTDVMAYRSIRHDLVKSPQIRLDDWIERTGIVPDALTIDVEGAELNVMHGAEQLLSSRRPLKIWISVHEDLMQKDYDAHPAMLMNYLACHGMTAQFLGADHEEHWLFWRGYRLPAPAWVKA